MFYLSVASTCLAFANWLCTPISRRDLQARLNLALFQPGMMRRSPYSVLYCRKTVGLYSDQILRYGEQNHILPAAFIASHGNRPASRTFKLCHIPLLIGSNHCPAIGTVHLSGNPFEILAFGVHSVQSPFFPKVRQPLPPVFFGASLLLSESLLLTDIFLHSTNIFSSFLLTHEHSYAILYSRTEFRAVLLLYTNIISLSIDFHEKVFVLQNLF